MNGGRGDVIITSMTPNAAIDFGTLCRELDTLSKSPPAHDEKTRARFERTLTDGYAQAHSLEAEQLRIERRIGKLAAEMSDRDREAVAALPARPLKPGSWRCRPSDDSAPDRAEASLAMPTWRPWRLCRHGRLNPARGDADPRTIPLRTARRRRLRCRPGGRGGFAGTAA